MHHYTQILFTMKRQDAFDNQSERLYLIRAQSERWKRSIIYHHVMYIELWMSQWEAQVSFFSVCVEPSALSLFQKWGVKSVTAENCNLPQIMFFSAVSSVWPSWFSSVLNIKTKAEVARAEDCREKSWLTMNVQYIHSPPCNIHSWQLKLD